MRCSSTSQQDKSLAPESPRELPRRAVLDWQGKEWESEEESGEEQFLLILKTPS